MVLQHTQALAHMSTASCRCSAFRAVPPRRTPRLRQCVSRAAGEQVRVAEPSQEAEQSEATKQPGEPELPSTVRTPLSGGWVGGETALKQLVELYGTEQVPAALKQSVEDAKQGASSPPAAEKKEAEKQNGARAKEEAAASPDDPAADETFAPLGGRGGFSGELGVQQFVKEGEIKFSDGRRRQFSPLIVAALIAVGVTSGALLFNNGVLFGEHAVEGVEESLETQLVGGGVDANTRLFLQAGLILLSLTGLIAGGRAAVRKLSDTTGRAFVSAGNLGKLGIFWIVIFVAIKFILDSQ